MKTEGTQTPPREPTNPAEIVRNICRGIILSMDESNAPVIVAKEVARRAMKQLDPQRKSPAIVQYVAIEGIAQIARTCLRGQHDVPDVSSSEETVDAFASELRERYVITRPEFEEPGYVLRDETTPDEIDKQVLPMLARRRDAFQAHIDLLRKWNDLRRH